METRWIHVTSENFEELRDASKEVCIIPMGCVEKHGLHLPLGTDILHSSYIVHEASKLETVTVFPDFTFGDVQANYPNRPLGTINISVETEMGLLEELCEQIAKNGYKKILIYNGHGGNRSWLSTFLRKLNYKHHDFVLATIMMRLMAPHYMAELLEEKGDSAIPELNAEDIALIKKYHAEDMLIGHGGMGETSYMMGCYPESVHMDRLGIVSGHSTGIADEYYKYGISICDGGWVENYPNAYTGDDPIGCNERIGKAAIRMEAERLAAAFKFFKEDENLIKWHNEHWGIKE